MNSNAYVQQFFKIIETAFKVHVLSDEQIVFGLLKGATYSKRAREDERWNERECCWVYDSEIEGKALALGVTPERLKEVFKSLESQGQILKRTDGDVQGGSYPKHAVVPRYSRRPA